MKFIVHALIIQLFLFYSVIYTQEVANKKFHPEHPILFTPTNHDPNFTSFPKTSFYKSRQNWQAIIDSVWGPGLPLSNKLQIFNSYTNSLESQFDGFLSLGMTGNSWDSLKNFYLSQISDSTSRGGFSAIMSRLANTLRDAHTRAVDTGVTWTPLNPGTPLLVLSSYQTIEHFGAVLTALPDSSLLVLRVVPNHPLGLQPGDIILGYQGIPWKFLVHELINAGLPFVPNGIGAESAYSDFLLLGAGMNWHLFETIDIIKYSSSDTVHLSVLPMINLNIPPMLNNEQLEIPDIPFPDYFNDQLVTYGILANTNIGYIYLFGEWPETIADQQFAEAVNALENTDGLIIDMRVNFGGWALFDDAFDILFNDFSFTIEDAYRESSATFSLSPSGDAIYFQINADPNSLYDRPIAILLGPTCISMGDITAQRFRYHPMVKFFGKPPGASMGDNLSIDNFQDWGLYHSISDMFHINEPGNYLNRAEFPINFPVWHNKDDVANGIDAVVEQALIWMNIMIYPYNVIPHSSFVEPALDTLTITTNVVNPNNHNINVATIIHTIDGDYIDSLAMFDDGNHGDSLADDGIYGGYLNPVLTEDILTISASVTDLDSSHYHILPNATRFTTVGPTVLDHYDITSTDTIPNPGNNLKFSFTLRNDGLVSTAKNITSKITCLDTFAAITIYQVPDYGDIPAGSSATGNKQQYIRFSPNSGGHTARFAIDMMSDEYMFWSDKLEVNVVISGLEEIVDNIPKVFSLKQNYPNPFNPTTTIEFSLPHTEQVTLKIYNILGEEVAALVSEKLPAGKYKYEWDARGLASGMYFYKLEAGDFVQTKKMLLIR